MIWKYIAGNNVKQAIRVSKNLVNFKYIPIINYTTEMAITKNDAIFNCLEYENILTNMKNTETTYLSYVAIKLSQFMFCERLIDTTVNMFTSNNIKVLIDAEDNQNNDRYNNISCNLINQYNNDSLQIYKTYQMYRKDSYKTLYRDILRCYKKNKYHGIKLVRGAYYYNEKNEGHLYNNILDTHNNYNKAIDLINNITFNKTNIIIASHNTESIKKTLDILQYNNDIDKFKFASLYGMNNYITNNYNYNYNYNNNTINNNTINNNIINNVDKMIYVPYGSYNTIIPYLSRRLYENSSMLKYMF